MIDVDITTVLGSFELAARFRSEGHVTALFGPSGAGKSSIVKAIAGLHTRVRGHVRIGETTLLDTSKGISLPVEKRRAGVVFQDGRLFPHLRVKDNLLYGYKRAPATREITPDRVIDVLGVAELLDRYPARLSGGERQRVALGRALLMQPRVLLMDEPLASLDVERKKEVLPYFGLLSRNFGIPIVYVTHDASEVFELANDLVLVSGGRVSAFGSLEEVTGRLDMPAGAEALGSGAVVEGVIDRHDPARGLTSISTRVGPFLVPLSSQSPGSAVTLRIAARDVALSAARPESISIQNMFDAEVEDMRPTGAHTVRVSLRTGSATLLSEVTADSIARLGVSRGTRLVALVKAAALVRSSTAR